MRIRVDGPKQPRSQGSLLGERTWERGWGLSCLILVVTQKLRHRTLLQYEQHTSARMRSS